MGEPGSGESFQEIEAMCGEENGPVAMVDVAKQTLTLACGGKVVRVYRVSTARAGVGAVPGSGCTPPGRHRVARLFGHKAVPGQVFVSRRAVKGHVIPRAAWYGDDGRVGAPSPTAAPLGRVGAPSPTAAPGKDYVLTRILWLEGLEPGVNKGPGIDSRERYIYIHGTNQEHLLGTPASHGCIRMANDDVIELFAFAKRHRNLIVDIRD